MYVACQPELGALVFGGQALWDEWDALAVAGFDVG